MIEALQSSDAISLSSRKLGLTALHIAAFFGQSETVRELLTHIPATVPSEPPISLAASFVKDLGVESGLTPLHLGAFSGEENVVRLLLNFAGVQVDAKTKTLVNFLLNTQYNKNTKHELHTEKITRAILDQFKFK